MSAWIRERWGRGGRGKSCQLPLFCFVFLSVCTLFVLIFDSLFFFCFLFCFVFLVCLMLVCLLFRSVVCLFVYLFASSYSGIFCWLVCLFAFSLFARFCLFICLLASSGLLFLFLFVCLLCQCLFADHQCSLFCSFVWILVWFRTFRLPQFPSSLTNPSGLVICYIQNESLFHLFWSSQKSHPSQPLISIFR